MMLEQVKEMLEIAKQEVRSIQYSRFKNAAVSVKNEIMEMVERVQEKIGRLAFPLVSAKYLAKIPNRDKVQDIEIAKNFFERNSITNFEQLKNIKRTREKSLTVGSRFSYPSGRDWNS